MTKCECSHGDNSREICILAKKCVCHSMVRKEMTLRLVIVVEKYDFG